MDFVKNYRGLPQKTKNLLNLGLILALLIALPLFIWALVNLNFNQREKAASGEPADIALGEPIIGLVDAPITIAIYSDFQCPFCKSFVDDTMSLILANYPNEVRLVFKDFPLISTHPLAENAAIAGQCAFAQGQFWEMHDLIFAKQTTLTENDLSTDFASQLSLDLTAYNSCYTGKETLEEVQDDMTEGMYKNVTGTPTFFIGLTSNFTQTATTINGAYPFSTFETEIEDLLLTLSASPTATSTSTSTSVATATATSLATATATATATSTSGTGGYVEGEPNSCGGTCGSNYNCKSNLYCYQGFCRNPICSNETDCDCSVSATATATSKPTTKANAGTTGSALKTSTPKSTSKATAKGSAKPTPTYTGGMTLIDKGSDLDLVRNEDTSEPELQNSFLIKYAKFIVGALAVVVITTIFFALKKKKDDSIPHITPPTNI